MSREMFPSVMPDQLQDYLTCPNLYYFKHVAKIPVPIKGLKWMDLMVHESILQTLKAMESTEFCLQTFEKLFTRGRDSDSRDVDIDFSNDSPEKLMVKGRGILQLYTGSPWFREMDLTQCHHTLSLVLHPLEQNALFVPCMVKTPHSITVSCRIDGIFKDNTLLDIHCGSRVVLDNEYARDLRFGFCSVALTYLKKYSRSVPTSVRSDILIKTIQPKLQIVHFKRSHDDNMCFLKNLYPLVKAIELELFYATPNILCANHCDYKRNCQSRFKNLIHIDYSFHDFSHPVNVN